MGLFDKFKKKQKTIAPVVPPEPFKPYFRTIDIHLPDGTVESMTADHMLTDKCVVCMGEYYHTSLFCRRFKWEMDNCDKDVIGMDFDDAKKQGINCCDDCARDSYLYSHGRQDEIKMY